MVNGHVTTPFCFVYIEELDRDPPPLFDLTLEPLAIQVFSTSGLIGLSIGPLEECISLFVDNTLTYRVDPKDSLLVIVEEFWDYSGFWVNWEKSNLFPIDPVAVSEIHPDSRLKLVQSFKYLGVMVQLPLQTYIPNNITLLISLHKANGESEYA